MPDRASQFIELIKQAERSLDDAAAQAQLATSVAEETADLFAQAGNANAHELMLAAAEAARQFVTAVASLSTLAEAAITQAQQAKGHPPTKTGTTPGSTREPTTRPPAQPQAPALSNFQPGRFHPKAARALEAEGWPRNADGRTSARAHLYDAQGVRIGEKTYRPYRKGAQPYRPELTEQFNDPQHTSTAWHAEADLAQDIRDGRLNPASVYLNAPLCGSQSGSNPDVPDPKRCSENFRSIIPCGVVVYVHVIPEHGMPSRKRIVGTGEGIR